ncbi:MAG: tetratricopeptide repeat protein [Gemmatimonadales bacterium]
MPLSTGCHRRPEAEQTNLAVAEPPRERRGTRQLRWLVLGVVALTPAGSGAAAAQTAPVEATSLLGKPLHRPPMSAAAAATAERNLAAAKRALDHTPENADSLIWYGRRLGYLGRYGDAIAVYTRAIGLHPADARLYRHRGHRYLTTRRLDLAIADFDKAYDLTRNRPDEIEPDGQPNARGIPTSTLKSNIRYHLGLAWYLKGEFARALPYYQEDVAAAVNPDMTVASSHWLYMTLRRLGRDADARRVIEPIRADLEIIENQSYHRLLLMYRGDLPADSILGPAERGDAIQDATVAYGVGNWHRYNGRPAEARRLFERILAGPQWGAFGYLAAEAELARER